MKKKILVVGPALSRSGYGEHCRFLMRSLRKYESFFEIFLNNTQWGNTNWIFEDNEERKWMDKILKKTILYDNTNNNPNRYDISAQVSIPNEWKKLAPINIGVTAGIETTMVTGEWVIQGLEMDHIIVVSEHSKKSYVDAVYDATNKETGKIVLKRLLMNFQIENAKFICFMEICLMMKFILYIFILKLNVI